MAAFVKLHHVEKMGMSGCCACSHPYNGVSQNTDTQVLSAGAVKRTRKQKSDSVCRAARDSTTGISRKDPFPLFLNPSESGQNYLDQPPSALPGTVQDTILPHPSSTAAHYHEAHDDGSQSSDIDEGDNPTAFTVIMNNTQDETPSAPFYAGVRLKNPVLVDIH